MTVKTEKAFVRSLVKASMIGEHTHAIRVSHSRKWTRESWLQELKRRADSFIYKGERINYWDIPVECEKLRFGETVVRIKFSWAFP